MRISWKISRFSYLAKTDYFQKWECWPPMCLLVQINPILRGFVAEGVYCNVKIADTPHPLKGSLKIFDRQVAILTMIMKIFGQVWGYKNRLEWAKFDELPDDGNRTRVRKERQSLVIIWHLNFFSFIYHNSHLKTFLWETEWMYNFGCYFFVLYMFVKNAPYRFFWRELVQKIYEMLL